MNTLYGKKVTIAPDVPRYQLPLDVPVPAAFREEFNQWALQFFGTTCMMADGDVMFLSLSDELVMSKRTWDEVRRSFPEDHNFQRIWRG